MRGLYLLPLILWIGAGVNCGTTAAATAVYVFANTDFVVAERIADGSLDVIATTLSEGTCVTHIREAGFAPVTARACNTSGCSEPAHWPAVGQPSPRCVRTILAGV